MIKITLFDEETLETFKQWVQDKSISEDSYYITFIKENKIQTELKED